MNNRKLLSKINSLLKKAPIKKLNEKWINETETVIKSFSEELYKDFKKEAYIYIKEERTFKDFPSASGMAIMPPISSIGGRAEIDNTTKVSKDNLEPRLDVFKRYLHKIKEQIEFELKFDQLTSHRNIPKSKNFIIDDNQINSISDKKMKALISELKFCYFADFYNAAGALIRAILERALNKLSPDIAVRDSLKNKINFTISNYKNLGFSENDKEILKELKNCRWVGNYILHDDLILMRSNIEEILKTICIFLLAKIDKF